MKKVNWYYSVGWNKNELAKSVCKLSSRNIKYILTYVSSNKQKMLQMDFQVLFYFSHGVWFSPYKNRMLSYKLRVQIIVKPFPSKLFINITNS